MNTITIPIETPLPLMELNDICKRYACQISHNTGIYYNVTTTDPINFFWLGMNLNAAIQNYGQ